MGVTDRRLEDNELATRLSDSLLSDMKDRNTVNNFIEEYHSRFNCFLSIAQGDACSKYRGIVELNQCLILEMSEVGVIVADVKKKCLLRVNDIDLSEMKHKEILDLSVEGDRWEGDVLNGEPFGWGVLYDKNNQRAYKGFQIRSSHVCYGRKYYADISGIEYEGEWCDGRRWGKGAQYDRSGCLVYSGEWLESNHLERRIEITLESEVLHNRIEELTVRDGCCNGESWRVLDLRLLSALRSLRVGDNCFKHVKEVNLVGLSALESLWIGSNSFVANSGEFGCDPNRRFSLKRCPSLTSLKMGVYSFSDYAVCEIEHCGLEVIEMGDVNSSSANFCCASLELKRASLHGQS